jgi:hypothetical protein
MGVNFFASTHIHIKMAVRAGFEPSTSLTRFSLVRLSTVSRTAFVISGVF